MPIPCRRPLRDNETCDGKNFAVLTEAARSGQRWKDFGLPRVDTPRRATFAERPFPGSDSFPSGHIPAIRSVMPRRLTGAAWSSADSGQLNVLRHRAAWLAEVALIVAFDVSYEWLRSIRSAAPAVATERARSVLAIERWLHVAVEQSINEFTTAHTWLASAAGYYYGALHFVVTPAALIWLWRRRQESYATWRTVLALATVGALVTYLVFPVAPPRLALPGFTDTLIASNVFGAADPHGVSGLINLYAAMPSLHVGWAFWVALAVFNSSSGRFRWLAWL